MALPKIDLPLFDITIPSTEQKTKFRPFTVKEEKILLIAQESKDIDQIITSIKQIINNTVQDVDVDKLAMFDLEYLLLNIRAKSVNNMLEFTISDPDTNENINIEIDISDIKLQTKPSHSKIIEIQDGFYLNMRYPYIDDLKILLSDETLSDDQQLFDLITSCIESVIANDELHKFSDYSNEEIQEFMDSLTSSTISNMQSFFDTMPVLSYETQYKLKDGTEKTFKVEGMETFFI